MKMFCIICAPIVFLACSTHNEETQIEKWKSEVEEVEKAFNDMAQKEGLERAFEYYAAEDGVIKRSNRIIKGKEAIREWYENDVKPNETLTWQPTFIEVSKSGDLAYTYGDFVFTYADSIGVAKQNKGIFHTVWRRQPDGNWRFVWD